MKYNMTEPLPREDILQVASNAGDKIMSLYEGKGDCQIYEKEDHTPVTDADLAANQVLTDELPKLVPIPLLSEEVPVTEEEVASWQKFWVIDPLDGTKGFIKSSDDFAINIAIVEDSVATFGMIYMPVTKQVFYAAMGQGAFQREATSNKWHKIQVNSPDNKDYKVPCKIIGSVHSKNPALHMIANNIAGSSLVNIGSAIKFTLIANGEATVYPRFGPTSWWDTAAGQCIVEEAGGKVVDGQLKPLAYGDYGKPTSFINPNFIAYAYDDPSWCEPWQGFNNSN